MFKLDFTGKTVLVSGASRGIGKAIALAFHELGATVYGTATSEKGAAAITEYLGGQGCGLVMNGLEPQSVAKLYEDVEAKAGNCPDVLVNNAGITRDGLLARMSEENFDSVIAVNQKSVFNMTKHAGSVMMKQKSGRIVNLSSVAGLHGNPGQFNYSASKAAIIGMTKTVAKELGSRGITCNAVAPGFIKTPMTDKLTDAQKEKILQMIAMRRYGTVEEIAGVVSFLASKDASYVTGQVIEISGGLSM